MTRRLLGIGLATGVVLLPPGAAAQQRGVQALDFMLQQADREIQRQNQLNFENQQRQEWHRLRQQFTALWQACHANQLPACEQALSLPYLDDQNRHILLAKRAALIAAQHAAEQARRQHIEAQLAEQRRRREQDQQAEHERRMRFEAQAADEQRRRQEQEHAAERARQLRLEAELEQQRRQRQQAERERAQDLARQQADTERLRREREQEEARLAELKAFSAERDACRGFNIAACDKALDAPQATGALRADLSEWRALALKLDVDLQACQAGSTAACDQADASPALKDYHRPAIQQWRTAASPFHQAREFVMLHTASITAAGANLATSIHTLPPSTHITGAIAAMLALALATMVWRSRRRPVGPSLPDSPAPAKAMPQIAGRHGLAAGLLARTSDVYRRLSRRLRRTWVRHLAARRTPAAAPAPAKPAGLPAIIPQRDTPAALAAMELANAYIDEVREAGLPDLDDEATRKQHLNTLSLASKQLDAAQRVDPDAILEGQDDKDCFYRLSISELKAQALLIEGLTHQVYDTRRAIPALVAATRADPSCANAFFALGLTHAANMNKAPAIEAFQRAVALDPKNLSYRKELNRVENVSEFEIVGYRATRAGEKMFDAGIKTANAGIRVWNIFAITWNIVTFPTRMTFRFLQMLGMFGR